jgi:hypothetical protein
MLDFVESAPAAVLQLTDKAVLSPWEPPIDRERRPDERVPEVRALMREMDAESAKGGSLEDRMKAITDAYTTFIGSLGLRVHDDQMIYNLQRVHNFRCNALRIEELVSGNLEPAKAFPSAGFKKTLVQALASIKPRTVAGRIDLADMVLEEFKRRLTGEKNQSLLSVMTVELSKWKERWTAGETVRQKALEFRTRVRALTSTPAEKSLEMLQRCTTAKISREITARMAGDIARQVHAEMKAALNAPEAFGPVGAALDEELKTALKDLGNPMPTKDWLAQQGIPQRPGR